MVSQRLRRNFLKYRAKILAGFILTTGITFILLIPNVVIQVEFEIDNYTDCQPMDLNQHIQVSINQLGFNTEPKEAATDLTFLPNLKNPCWYESFDERDLEYTKNSPYRFPYNPTFTGPQNLFQDDLNHIADLYAAALKRNKTTRLRCIPYFYIVGQSKCATSDLYTRISSHPKVRKGLVKESQWWPWTRQGVILSNGTILPLELSDLADLFSLPTMELETTVDNQCNDKNSCQQLIFGDGSIYTWDAAFINMKTGKRRGTFLESPITTPQYIKWLIPNVKLIVMARQPADRLYSAYKYFKHNKYVPNPEDFHTKVVSLIERFTRCVEKRQSVVNCAYDREFREEQELLISDSLYGLYIEEWLRVVGPDNLLVIRTEDYKQNRRETLKTTFKFLGLCDVTPEEENAIVDMPKINEGQVNVGPMLPATKKLLNEFFQPYNEKMVRALNDERFYWNDYQ